MIEWPEHLAAGRFEEALSMFPCSDEEMAWTGDKLANWISHYGSDDPDPDGNEFTLTSLPACASREEINRCIVVDRAHLYGLPKDRYLGMVHYRDVPLDAEPSDLTARFHIMKVGADRFTLEFLDIHVM